MSITATGFESWWVSFSNWLLDTFFFTWSPKQKIENNSKSRRLFVASRQRRFMATTTRHTLVASDNRRRNSGHPSPVYRTQAGRFPMSDSGMWGAGLGVRQPDGWQQPCRLLQETCFQRLHSWWRLQLYHHTEVSCCLLWGVSARCQFHQHFMFGKSFAPSFFFALRFKVFYSFCSKISA